MWFKNKALATAFSLYVLSWTTNCAWNDIKNNGNESYKPDSTELLKFPEILEPDSFNPNWGSWGVTENTEKQLSLCLETDTPEVFTTTKALESVNDPENTILELPLSQLFKKYWNRPHPLAVRWIDKNLTSLLWEHWIEELSDSIPQKLSPRKEKITSETQYEAWDTLRFALIDPFLQWVFPQNLSQQLKEDWFETFSDSDASDLAKKIKENQNSENIDKKSDFIYDIVVKKLPSWEWVMGLYRDWELFMATYVSVWLNSRKTKTWQFEVLWTNPYYFSRKYKSPMSGWVYFDEWWRWFHQWKVRSRNHEWVIKRWFPASHGCIRLPGAYALSLYSLVKGKKHVDVFISKNLYNTEK